MVKAVLFDLFETLITESSSQPAGASSLGSELGFESEAFRNEWKARRPDIVIGRLSLCDAVMEIGAALEHEIEPPKLQRALKNRSRVKATAFAPVEPKVFAVVSALRRLGIRLGVVSNCFAEDVVAWPNCSLAAQVDCTVFSFEVELAKPNPAIYQEACRRLEVPASATLFIGDGDSDELSGAEQAGIRAFQALWFLQRWPHFNVEQVSTPNLTNIEDVLALVP